MKVYHASQVEVAHPDVSFSRDALDFGKGFYVTCLREQVVKYAEKFLFRGKKAVINSYELDEGWRKYNVRCFDTYNEDWIDFVAANRHGDEVEAFDAVEGGIANDKIFRTLDLYFSGDITKEDALKRLRYEKPNHQICLLSQQLIDKHLKFLSSEVL
ncbi:MAG: DUF3990 domain-containing protein [Bacteroidaceae bacterium]|nr:DUF3990 domain-containing protein [Bacteroidaceae bacterium]